MSPGRGYDLVKIGHVLQYLLNSEPFSQQGF